MGASIKGRADYWEPGTWNAVCSLCGAKRKASQLKKHWQGFYRCPEHWEARHPQDFVKGIQDVQAVPWSQPPVDTYVYFCTFNGQSAIPGWAIPDCMLPGNTSINPEEPE